MVRSGVYIFPAFLLVLFSIQAVFSEPLYSPTWDSLDSRPIPKWYDEAKVGIFLHWGVYSVPSYGNENFWYNWKVSATKGYETFMKNFYSPEFTYQEFAKDFRAELFDPEQWAQLVNDSGARYAVVTSKYADGYTLWPSSYSFSWNSMDVGPHKNIISELYYSMRRLNLKFGLYYSLSEWNNKLYNDDKLNGFKQQKYVVNKVHPELVELVNLFNPDILWSDVELEANSEYWNATEFLAWLYNKSPSRNEIVTNDRWGSDAKCKHGGFLTCSNQPGVLPKRKWEKAFSLDKTSYGHRFDSTLKDLTSSDEIIKEIVTTVSYGGNVLINVGPTRHGTIQPIFEERLLDMGKWLKINGEAIYGSQPWIVQQDPTTEGVWYTQKYDNLRERIMVYAMVSKYPFDRNAIDFYALGGRLDNSTTVTMLGYSAPLVWAENNYSLYVQFPDKNLMDKRGLKHAWTFKISIPTNKNVTMY